MNIIYYISDELLFDYVNGVFEEGWSIVVVMYFVFCLLCCKWFVMMEVVGGMVFEVIEIELVSVLMEDFLWEVMCVLIYNFEFDVLVFV